VNHSIRFAFLAAAFSLTVLAGCKTAKPVPDGLSFDDAPSAPARPPVSSAVKSWVLPPTANGLVPTQCWFSIAAAPDGGVYIGASDHETNSALYRIDSATDELTIAGDARTASEAARNWLPGETAEKFHVRPIYWQGRVYVATTDYSSLDPGYIRKRGFHWYAYDLAEKRFIDLSASEPKGVAGEHASIMATCLDAKNGLLYGLESPHGWLYQYDSARKRTVNLGRPKFLKNEFYNAGRYIWADDEGRVYYTVAGVDNVLVWDPAKGFVDRTDWKMRSQIFRDKSLRLGQWTADGMRCYLADYEANFYLFNNADKSFTWLGRGEGDSSHYMRGETFRIRVLNVTADEKTIFFANDNSVKFSLFEYDIASKKTRRLCYLSELDSRLADPAFFNRAGNDSWDDKGRFYIASFGAERGKSPGVLVTRIDPVLLKKALGL
jgi:hypothetical protein